MRSANAPIQYLSTRQLGPLVNNLIEPRPIHSKNKVSDITTSRYKCKVKNLKKTCIRDIFILNLVMIVTGRVSHSRSI